MNNFDPSIPNTQYTTPPLSLSPFTTREVDIIACLLHRRSSKKIGALLSLSSKTVSNHICNIMSKVGCTSREGILDYVEKVGYMPLLRQHYAHLNPTAFVEEQEIIKALPNSTPPLTKKSKIFWAIGISVFLMLIGGGVFFSLQLSSKKVIESVARSDFILPSENVLLNRPELIRRIEEKLTEKPGIQTVALIGMGGVGKTTLARQFARQQKTSVIWELNAETNQSLHSSFEDLAISLAKAPEDKKTLREIQETKDEKERETKLLSFVKERLRPLSNWLLIYDNVEKFSDIQKYFPHDPITWGVGKVLITTTDNNIQNDSHVNYGLQIGELNSNQKLALFSKIVGNDHLTKIKKEQAQQFLEKIPPFPLDISVAAYYLKTTNIPFERYINYIHQSNPDFENTQEKILKEGSDYSKTRYNIITTSLQSLINTNKEFADLLLLISLIDSQNIPRELLVKYKNEIVVDDFIYHLKKYSLITNEASIPAIGSTLSIHRSTQAVMLASLTKNLNLRKNGLMIKRLCQFLENQITLSLESENTFWIKSFVKHLEAFLSRKNFLNDIDNIYIKGSLGCLYFYLGEYKRSKNLIEKNILQLKKHPDFSHLHLARFLIYLGIVYRELGDYRQAEKTLTKSLNVYKNKFPDNEKEIAFVLSNLANVYRNLGKYQKAKELFEKNIVFYSSNPPKTYVDFAWFLLYSGYIYQDLNDYKKAKEQYEKCIAICQEHLSKNHIINAWVLSSLGNIYREFGNLEKAKNLIEQAVSICKIHLSDNHVGYAFITNHLGCVYREKGDYKKARALFEKSLLIYKIHYKKVHVRTALTLEELAKLDLLQGRRAEGVALFKESLKRMEENKSPSIYMILEDLAEVYFSDSEIAFKNGQKKQSQELRKIAISYLRQAHESILKHFPKDSPHIIRIQKKFENLEEKCPIRTPRSLSGSFQLNFCRIKSGESFHSAHPNQHNHKDKTA
jgi:tetratricopeptide (TPR) repeat protein/DNA-binding CsgD family transcriptional regulator